MRRSVCFLFFSLFVLICLSAQSNACESAYMPFVKGVSFELTTYSQKGKKTGSVSHDIAEVSDLATGYRATVYTQLSDDKGKPTTDGRYTIDCTSDGIVVDVSSLLNSQTMAAFSAMEVDVTGDGLQIPNTLTPGQTLPDASLHMKASMNGLTLIQLNMQITNRKVIGKEKITTPAGAFDCVKLAQTTSLDGFGKSTYESTTWLARGVGTVRTENYDKKGELGSYSELTVFKK